MNVMAKIITLLKAFGQRDDVVSSTRLDRTDGGPASFPVEMPMPRFGTFTGKQADWQEFRDTFIAQVHEKDYINPVDKMTYLQEACQGDAKVTQESQGLFNNVVTNVQTIVKTSWLAIVSGLRTNGLHRANG